MTFEKKRDEYKNGLLSRNAFIKILDSYDVNYEDYGLTPYSTNELAQILKLNSTLKGEMTLVLKYWKDFKNLSLYDIPDVKAVVSNIIDRVNEWDTKPYGFVRANLNALLRQISLAEISAPEVSLPATSNIILSIDGIHTGEEFETFCAKLLEKRGYTNVSLTQSSGDHGVDVLAEKDDVSYAIQCKYYSSPVGNSAIQEVFSGKKLYKRDVAVVMTNSTFTAQALGDAAELGVKLWDGSKIESWIAKSS